MSPTSFSQQYKLNARRRRQKTLTHKVHQRKMIFESLEDRQLMATMTWDGGGADGNWTTAANWATNVAPTAGDDLVFTGNVRTTNNNNFAAGTTFNSITFNASAGNFTISGNQITLNGGNDITVVAGTQWFQNPFVLSSTSNVDVQATSLAMTGVVSGSGGFTKTGIYGFDLHAANTFSGGVTIKAGWVAVVSTSTALGSGTVTIGDSSNAVATLIGAYSGAGSVPNAINTVSSNAGIGVNAFSTTFSGPVTLNSNLRLYSTGTVNLAISGAITGTGNVVVDTPGTAAITVSGSSINNIGTITNAGTGSGTTVISAPVGSSVSGITQASTTSAFNVTGGVTLAASATKLMTTGSLGFTLSGIVSGAGGLVKTGSGALTVMNANTYGGGTTIKEGTIVLGNNTALGTGTVVVGDSTGNKTAVLYNAATGTFANAISIASGNVGVAMIDASNSGTFSGGITLNEHNLRFASGAGATSITGGFSSTGTNPSNIDFAPYNAATITVSTGSVNIKGVVANDGAGTGAVTINSAIGGNVTGMTQKSSTSAFNLTGTVTVNSTGTTLTTSAGTKALTLSGNISGTGNLILNNNSALSGGIVLSGSSISPTGLITNSGSGSGDVTIGGAFGANVTGLVQNSVTSALTLTGASPLFTAGLLVKAGSVGSTAASASGFGSGTITLGETGSSAWTALVAAGSGALVGGYTNPVVLVAGYTGAAAIYSNYATAAFSGGVTLNGQSIRFSSWGSTNLTMSGAISGTGNVILDAPGTGIITVSGPGINNIGTITNSGTGGATNVVSAPVGSNVSGITQASTTSALNVTGAMTVGSGGTTLSNSLGTKALTVSGGVTGTGNLVLKNNSATNFSLAVSGATVNNAGMIINSGTGSGRALIDAAVGSNVSGITQNSTTSDLEVAGTITVNAGGTTLTNAAGTKSLLVRGVSGTGNLILKNDSTKVDGIVLSSNTVNNSGLVINSGSGNGSVLIGADVGSNVTGITQASATSALAIFNVIVNSGGTTLSSSAGATFITQWGNVSGSGNFIINNNSNASDIVLQGTSITNAGTIINSGTGVGQTHIYSVISTSGTSIHQNSSTSALLLRGQNTHTGGTTVNAGALYVNSFGKLGGASNSLIVDGSSAVLNLGSTTQSIGSVTLNNGGSINNGILGGSSFALNSGSVGTSLVGPGAYKSTSGVVTLSGIPTFSSATTVHAGKLLANFSELSSGQSISVEAGATLGGIGTLVRSVLVASGGKIDPGVTTGNLTAAFVTLSTGSSLDVQIGGTTAGSGYDQLSVNGASSSLNIGSGVTLNVSSINGFVPTAGETYTIVNNLSNATAVVGAFAGLPEGSILYAGTSAFRITYVGGTGNDIVLTAIPDLQIHSLIASGGQLTALVDVLYAASTPFTIGLYRSSNGTTLDALLTYTSVTDPALLSPANGHSIVLDTSFVDPQADYFLVAKLDSGSAITETSEANNQVQFAGGAFVDGNGVLQIHRGSGNDFVGISEVSGNVTVSYSPATTPPYWDVDGDGLPTQADVTLVTNMKNKVLAAPQYMNPNNPNDVNNDGIVDSADAQAVNDYLASGGTPSNFVDVSGDGVISPLDMLTVINFLNGQNLSNVAKHYNNPWDIDGNGTINAADVTTLEGIIPQISTGVFSLAVGKAIHIRTHQGNDIVKAGSAIARPMWVFGGEGDDTIASAAGDDFLSGGEGHDTIAGLSGHDEVQGNGGNDWLYGGLGNDIITGGTGHDQLHGDAGADSLDGESGSDELYGDAGDDSLTDQDGVQDILDGGTGSDTLPTGNTASNVALNIAGASESPAVNNGPGILDGDIFIVPGAVNEMVTINFEWAWRDAGNNNEIGIYFVDDERGAVSGILPGQAGYAAAALLDRPGAQPDNFHVLFASGESPGPTNPAGGTKPNVPIQTSVSLRAGTKFSFYVVQAGPITSNATALGASGANATFFKINQANFDIVPGAGKDGFPHFLPSQPGDSGHKENRLSYKFEDLRPSEPGFDSDYNDGVFSLYIERTLSLTATNRYGREVDLTNPRELKDPVEFTVSRGESVVGGELTVQYQSISTGAQPGISAGDVTEALTGAIVIDASESSNTIKFTPVDDSTSEWDEELKLQISGVTNPPYYTTPSAYGTYYSSTPYPSGSTSSTSLSYQPYDPGYPTRATILVPIYVAPTAPTSAFILDDDGVAGEVNRNVDPGTTGQTKESVGNGMISVDLQQGDAQLALALAPAGYVPTYRSDDNLHPLVSLEWLIPGGMEPSEIVATLTFGGFASEPVTLELPEGLDTSEPIRMVLLGSDEISEALKTGHYDYDIKLEIPNGSTPLVRTVRGTSEIANLSGVAYGTTEFGNRWWVDGLDRTVPDDGNSARLAPEGLAAIGGQALVRGDSSSAWYVAHPENYQFLDSPTTSNGTWTTGTMAGGYGGSYKVTNTLFAEGRWTVQGLQPGRQYQIFATWVPGKDRTPAAYYEVNAKPIAKGQDTGLLNQRYTPGEVVVNGTSWRSLGFYEPKSSSSFTVKFTNAGVGAMVVDSLMIVSDWSYETALGSYDSLNYDAGKFDISDKYGTAKEFNQQGLLQKVTDRNQNRTEFTYVDADIDGRQDEVSRITDQGNLQTNYVYSGGKLDYVTDFAGRITDFTISGGLVTQVSSPAPGSGNPQPVSTFAYNGPDGLLSQVTDGNSHSTSIGYDSSFRINDMGNPDGNHWQLTPFLIDGLNAIQLPIDAPGGTYNDSMRALQPRATYTDPRTNAWIYQTDAYGLKRTLEDPTNATWFWNRNAYGQPTAMEEPSGGGGYSGGSYTSYDELHTAYAYETTGDGTGNLLSVAYADGKSESWNYGAFNQVTTFTNRNEEVTTYTLDGNGNATTIVQVGSPSRTTTMAYTAAPSSVSQLAAGLQTSQTVASGSSSASTTATEYFSSGSAIGLVKKVTIADGTSDAASTQYAYNGDRNLTTVTDADSRVTSRIYDRLDRMISESLPNPATGGSGGPTTIFGHDAMGNVTRMEDPRSAETTYLYDEMNRLAKKTLETISDLSTGSAGGAPEYEYTYDANGNLESATAPDGRDMTYVYDTRNLLTSTTRSLSNVTPNAPSGVPTGSVVTTSAYDTLGNLAAVTDARGNATHHRYNQVHQRTAFIEPAPELAGKLGAEDHGAQTTTYTLDGLGRILSTNAPGPNGSRTTTNTIDRLGRTSNTQLPTVAAGTPTLQTSFDLRNNPLSQNNSGQSSTSTFNRRNELLTSNSDADGTGGVAALTTTNTVNSVGETTASSTAAGSLARASGTQYDKLGRVTQTTDVDPDGAGPLQAPVVSYTYDANGNVTKEERSVGGQVFVTETQYDELNRPFKSLVKGVGAQVITTTFGYNLNGELVKKTDQTGAIGGTGERVTTYDYDSLGRLTVRTDPKPSSTSATPTTSYYYDENGNTIFARDALGRVSEFAYDALNRPKIAKGPALTRYNGEKQTAEVVYAPSGEVLKTIDPLYYNASGTQWQARVTETDFDNLGRAVTVRLPNAGNGVPTMSYGYDLRGNVVQSVDAEQNETVTLYNSWNQPVSTTAEGRTTYYEYDSFGQLLSMTDPLNQTTKYEYDGLGRVTRKISPRPDETTATTPVEQVKANSDAVYASTTGTWQASGDSHYIDVTGTGTHTATWSIDNLDPTKSYVILANWPIAAGNASAVSIGLYDDVIDAPHQLGAAFNVNQTTLTSDVVLGDASYQELGRVTAASGTLRVRFDASSAVGRAVAGTIRVVEQQSVETTVYDQLGNVLSVTDGLGHKTLYGYDDFYRLTSLTDANGDATTFGYDTLGRRTSVLDAEGNLTSFVYDDLDRVVSETVIIDSVTKIRTFEYDLVGNLKRAVDRNGHVRVYAYDELDRLDTETWYLNVTDANGVTNAQNTIIYTYDMANRLVGAVDAHSNYAYTYDVLDRVLTVTDNNFTGNTVALTNGYERLDGLRSTLAATIDGTADFLTGYHYDELLRMDLITQTGQTGGNTVADKRIGLTYNDDNQFHTITRYAGLTTTPLVATSTFGYDDQGRLTSLTHTQGATSLASYTWAFDAANRIRQMTSVDGVVNYSYDDRGQLTGADYNYQADEAYTYDDNGNRTNTGYSTGDYNRPDSDGTFNYEYDAEGNRTLRTNIVSGAVTEYGWDVNNRLIKITERASALGAATKIVDYTYDMYGRRIAKAIDSDGDSDVDYGQRYTYDGDHVALVFDQDGDLTNRLLHGPMVDQILADEQVTSLSSAGDVLWPLTDNLGSVRDLVSYDSGTDTSSVDNHLLYDAFGRVISESNTAVDHLFGFTGRERDEESGLNYHRARYVDPVIGQFLSEDPIGFDAGDLNTRRFVFNNPLAGTDPDGMSPAGAEMALSAARNAKKSEAATWRSLARLGRLAVKNGLTDGNSLTADSFERMLSVVLEGGTLGAEMEEQLDDVLAKHETFLEDYQRATEYAGSVHGGYFWFAPGQLKEAERIIAGIGPRAFGLPTSPSRRLGISSAGLRQGDATGRAAGRIAGLQVTLEWTERATTAITIVGGGTVLIKEGIKRGGVEGAKFIGRELAKQAAIAAATHAVAYGATAAGVPEEYVRVGTHVADLMLLARAVRAIRPEVPQGISKAKFAEASSLIRERLGARADQVVVQGSRARGTAKPTSDIDFALRESPDAFSKSIKDAYPQNPGPEVSKGRGMIDAIFRGRIFRREAGLRSVALELERILGIKVDFSKVEIGGLFDKRPFIPLSKD
jgi:RHS repeat-associated protein